MLNQKFFKTSIFLIWISFFFTNCQIYGPATSGNPTVLISRPWYEGEPVSSVNIGVRGNTGNTFNSPYNSNEKNRFGEASLSYSRVFEGGYWGLNAGAYLGQYKKLSLTPMAYNGSTFAAQVGIHAPSIFQLLTRTSVNNRFTESSIGIGYEWKTEYGDYYKFRELLPDTVNLLFSQSTHSHRFSSHHLHKLTFFKDFRQQINPTNFHGLQTQVGFAFEGNYGLTDLQTGLTYYFTHKQATFYAQGSFSLNESLNFMRPLFGLGINYAVWTK